MSLADAFASHETHQRNVVMRNTWGHLAPEPRRAYPGTIIFTQSEYGDLVPIRSNFEGMPDSPWFYDHLCDFVADKASEPGTVYKFTGTYTLFKNGNYRFSGTVTLVDID